MRAYLTRRLLLVIPTLFILSILVFLSVRFIPGDVIDAMQGRLAGLGVKGGAKACHWGGAKVYHLG